MNWYYQLLVVTLVVLLFGYAKSTIRWAEFGHAAVKDSNRKTMKTRALQKTSTVAFKVRALT